MSETFEIVARTRSGAGKGASRRLRKTGMVPGIVYGGHLEPIPISLEHSELIKHLEHEAFYSHVLDLKLDGTVQKVVLKDLQRHPAKPFVLHVDFQRISAQGRIRMHVPVHYINEGVCPGIKKGGIVTRNIVELEVTCLPQDLPEFIAVDMAELDLGHTLHVSDLKTPAGVELSHTLDPRAPVVSIHGARGGSEAEGEGETGAPGAAPKP
jgi:large subunit ribosomal protein L25